MEITKPNDIFVAMLNTPTATTYDLINSNLNGTNTSLYTKDQYKNTKLVQDTFKTEDGKFDDLAFNEAYNNAASHYNELTNDAYIKGLNEITYSPFDVTRPKGSNTFKVDVEYSKDFNPFKQLYSRSGINSVDDSEFSLRELAQQEKVYDPITKTWSKESANDLGLLDKIFGSTLVYAQWDEDGIHPDPESGRVVNHKKGDWKINENGNLFLEKLGNREIYGKQVVNSMDMLTADGSFANQYDFLDSDSKEKSITGTAFKIAFEIAPFLIPEIGAFKGLTSIPNLYGGVRAAVGLTSVLPTFYKSIEGLFLGDKQSDLGKQMNRMEGYMSKYNQSISDEGQKSMFTVEQMSSMVSSIFSQIYEQRAVAGLSKIFINSESAMTAASAKVAQELQKDIFKQAIDGKIDMKDIGKIQELAMSKIPELKSIIDKQSKLSKSLSLGYMALTSTSDVYGAAIEGGYDRRTAGFAALAAASGQYAIMMNNELGSWFLDKTTGYSTEINKAAVRKATLPWLKDIEEVFTSGKNVVEVKSKLSGFFPKIKNSLNDLLLSPSELGEAMWKNSLIEGIEEVTEQAVMDMTKGVIDVLSYFGATEKQGSFGGLNNVFSKEGLENYLANFVGGLLGGSMFEFQRVKIAPLLTKGLTPETKKSMYELIASGHKNELIKIIDNQRTKLGNNYLSTINEDGIFLEKNKVSQADVIADTAINMINEIDGILNSYDFVQSDENIVKKAIMDQLIIQDLEKHKREGKIVGIEGLVLSDYKNSINEVIRIESEIKALGESEEDIKNISNLKKELKLHVTKANDILEGKYAMKYFDQLSLLLNTKINSSFLITDRKGFAKHKYGVNYNDLSEDGLGLTKKRINEEWSKSLENKDLTTNLEIATNSYKEWEKQLNPSIEKYATNGYVQIRTETYKNIIDLKNTLTLFNTTNDPVKKQEALDRFIEINNNIQKLGYAKVLPWDVLQNDLFEQLDEQQLIKKSVYKKDSEGNWIEEVEDYTPEELSQIIHESETEKFNKKDFIKDEVQTHFKQFNANPLDIEPAINTFNTKQMYSAKKKMDRIDELESKPFKTEEELNELKELNSTLYSTKISNINETKTISDVIQKFSDIEIDLKQNYGKSKLDKSDPDLAKNAIIQANLDLTILGSIISNINAKLSITEELKKEFDDFDQNTDLTIRENLDKLNFNQLLNILKTLSDSGAIENTILELSKIADNTLEVFNDSLQKLNDVEIDEESRKNDFIENTFNILTSAINLQNKWNLLLSDKDLLKLASDLEKNINSREKKIAEEKPEFFKLRNYAFELLVKELQKGSADEEIFIEAKNMYEEEASIITTKIFGNNIGEYGDISILINEAKKSIDDLNAIIDSTDTDIDELPNWKNVKYESDELTKIITNNANDDWTIEEVSDFLQNLINNIEINKKDLEKLNKFEELVNKGLILKTNELYNFIRNFELSLNSNSNNKVSKIMDIFEREAVALKASSTISNFISDGIRESDINQAIDTLNIIKAVISAMSTTEVNFGDPYGFILSRQNFAIKNGLDDDVKTLKTITSDVATLMSNDVDRLINKLQFLKNLTDSNSGKISIEQEIIRKSMDTILLNKWEQAINKLPISFLPKDKVKEILASSEKDSKKLMLIENLFYDTNKDNKVEALNAIILPLGELNKDDFSKIDRDVKEESIKNWDLALYFATTLSIRSEDWHMMSLMSLDSFSKAPFYTQELVAKFVKASTINPELFSNIVKQHRDSTSFDTDFITFILGGAGTGKTTAVFGLDIEHFKLTNDNSIIRLVAPTDLQTNNLNSAIVEANGTDKINVLNSHKSELYEQLGISKIMSDLSVELEDVSNSNNKYIKLNSSGMIDLVLDSNWINEVKFENLPNLLLIDEVTHFSSVELHVLNEISRHSYNRSDANFMKIIAAGDPTQLGYSYKNNNQYLQFNINAVNGIFTPRLWSTVRTANNQKRSNNDFLVGLTQRIEKLYVDYREDRNEAQKLASELLIKEPSTLEWYQNDNSANGIIGLNGDIITEKLTQSQINTLKVIIDNSENKITIGILTDKGEIEPSMKEMFEKAGIIDNIKTFTPKNIQGSEVDYFIFNVNTIKHYDTFRDSLKGLYTYMSRSKNGTIIIDDDIQEGKNYLKRTFGLENANKSIYTTPFEPLTKNVIDKVKAKRKLDLEELLGTTSKLSPESNFKWKMGKKSDEPEILIEDEIIVDDVLRWTEPFIKSEEDESKLIPEMNAEDFKVMFHSFYKNPNAEIINNKINSVNEIPFDLNFGRTIDYKKEIINSWLNTKNLLLAKYLENNNTKFSFDTDEKFIAYLSEVFQYDFKNSKSINVEVVLTATKYDDKINAPYNKHNDDKDNHLKNGTPFINLSAKIEYNGKIHYITLASFSSKEKLIEHFNKKVKESNEDEKLKKSELKTKIDNRFTEIYNDLKSTDFIEYELNGKIEYLTGTRIIKPNKETNDKGEEITPIYSLQSLKSKFPDAYFSEIRLFPKDQTLFNELIKENHFEGKGKELTPEFLEDLFLKLRNKPYVQVKFTSINTSTNQGKLIPIFSKARTIVEITKEANDLIKRVRQKAAKLKKDGKPITVDDFKDINLEADMMTNKSNILDILISWGKTSTNDGTLLQLLSKTFKNDSALTGTTEISILDVLSRFKKPTNSEDASKFNVRDALMKVISTVEKYIKENPNLTSKNLKTLMLKNDLPIFSQKWNENFHNLFAYKNIIDSKDEISKREAIMSFVFGTGLDDDTLVDLLNENNEAFTKVAKSAEILIKSLISKNVKLFYSLPIEPVGTNYVIKGDIDGKTGFENDLFNRFYINVIPEPARLLGEINVFLNSNIVSNIEPITPTSTTIVEPVEPVVTPDVPVQSSFINKFIQSFEDLFNKEFNEIKNDNSLTDEEKIETATKLKATLINLELINNLSLNLIKLGSLNNIDDIVLQNEDVFSENDTLKERIGKYINILGIKMDGLESITDSPAGIIASMFGNPDGIHPAKLVMELNKQMKNIDPTFNNFNELGKEIIENYNKKCK